MKQFLKNFSLAVFAFGVFLSCGNDDYASATIRPSNQFTFQQTGQVFNTPNAYLFLDSHSGPYNNGFILGLINGIAREDNVNGVTYSDNMTHGAAIHVTLGNTDVLNESDITNAITNGTTFPQNDEGTIITDIINFNNQYVHNGATYGDIDMSGANEYIINATGSGSITINSFTVDLILRTGYVDCTYTLTDDLGNTFNGQFVGNFEIMNDF